MSFTRLVVIAAVLLSCAAPAAAQTVKLRFHDGLVTLTTQNAPLRAILNEWARQGGATIINGERVAGPPLSLELNAVPERQALDVLLRSVSGYMLGPRSAGTSGAAVFDRIMILPTSTPPANPPPTQAGRGFPPPRQVIPQPAVPQPLMPQLPFVPNPDELEEDLQDLAPDDDVPPVVPPQLRPRPLPRDAMPQGGAPMPLPFEIPQQDDADVDPAEQPTMQPLRPTPGNPFGLPAGSTSRPGIVTPVPQGPQQRTPRTEPEP